MARFRRRRSRGGGGGGGGAGFGGPWGGTILIVLGSVAMVICLVMFGIGIGQLDTAYTSASSYSEMTSLTDIMGVFGVIIFLAFMILGLGAIAGGTYLNIRKGLGGNWSSLAMLAIFGGISLVISLIMFNVNLTQLHSVIGTANATTNYSSFVGLGSIMGIWGMVIFIVMIGASLAQFGGAGFGVYKKIKH